LMVIATVGNHLLAQPIKYQEGSKIYDKAEKQPEFPGGEKEFREYTRRPFDNDFRDYYCDVLLSCVIEKDGTLTKVKVLMPITDRECTEQAIKLLKHSPKWSPGLVAGKPVRVRLTTTIELNYVAGSFTSLRPAPKNLIYTSVEEVPQFIGGMDAFQNYLKNNLNYPPLAMKNGTQGKVIVSFIVERNGKLTQVKVSRGIGDDCDEEALRLIKKTAKNWIPGKQNGIAVRTAYSIPINFILPDKKY